MPDRRRYARTPDTIGILAAMLLAGVLLTITGQQPVSVLEVSPDRWIATLWSAMLAASAGVALAGVLWKDDLHGWVLEIVGRAGLVPATLGYVVALLGSMTSLGPVLVISLVGSLSVASCVRLWQLLRRWREFLAYVRGARR